MPATMRDVARSAGVSTKTVSNVANGYQHVSPTTRARGLRALLRAGVRVPEDVALIGFDDIGESRYAFASLSTVPPGGPRSHSGASTCCGTACRSASPTARTTRTAQSEPDQATPVRSTSQDRYVSPGLSTVEG